MDRQCNFYLSITFIIVNAVFSTSGIIFGQNVGTLEEAAQFEENSVSYGRTWRKESYENAASSAQRASEIWSTNGKVLDSIRCKRREAQYRLILGEAELALVLLNTARSDSRFFKMEAERSLIASDLAEFHLYKGDPEKSRFFLDEAIQIAELSGDNVARAEAQLVAGEYFYTKNEVKKAISVLNEAREWFRRANDTQGESRASVELSYAYLKVQDFEAAIATSKFAFSISETSGDTRTEAFSRQALAKVHIVLSENSKAFSELKAAETLFPDDLDSSQKGALLNALAHLYEQYGDLRLTLDYRLRAYALFKKDNHLFGQLGTISDLAEILYVYGETDRANAYLVEGEQIATRLGDNYNLARIYENFGSFFLLTRRPERAIHYFERAAELFTSKDAARPANRVKHKTAKALLLLGKNELANKILEDVYKFSAEINDRYAQSDVLFDLAIHAKNSSNLNRSMELTRRSIDLTDGLYFEIANTKLQTTYLSTVYDRYETLNEILLEMHKRFPGGGYDLQALSAIERSRSRRLLQDLTLSENAFLQDASLNTVTKEKELRLDLNLKADKLTEALSTTGDMTVIDPLQSEIRGLENELEDLRAEVKEKSPIYSAIKNPEAFDVGDFQANVLDDGSVLLEFSLGTEESYLWAVSKTEVSAFYLPSRERIEGRVEKLRGLLAQTGIREGETVEDYQRRVAEAEVVYKAEARSLSEDLLGQAADKIAGKRLIIVADGKLLYFPIGSLPMPGTASDEPILLTNEVVYEPSASALKILKSERAGGKKPEKDLLVFADPVFSKTDERLTGMDTTESTIATTLLSVFRSGGSLEKLPRLPASEEEAISIRDVVGSGQTTVRSGFAANRDGVINSDIENYKILHFATHGLIDEKRPELSGILLSLYDKDGKAQDGGVIRLQDVYGLNLRSDLVVLSACETGIGKEVRGEGLMSLNNAFLQAGAKTVVSSLWKVDDTATKQLMTKFYQGIATEGLTASAALRQAQIAMYKDPRYASPFHWAAFTAQGDYQRVPGISVSYSRYVVVGVLMFLTFGFIFLKARRPVRSGSRLIGR